MTCTQINGWPMLSRLLKEGMDSYNEINAAMNLVLFEDAMMHVCRSDDTRCGTARHDTRCLLNKM